MFGFLSTYTTCILVVFCTCPRFFFGILEKITKRKVLRIINIAKFTRLTDY